MQSPDRPLQAPVQPKVARKLPAINPNPTFRMSIDRPDSQSLFKEVEFPLPDGGSLTGMIAAITKVVSTRNQTNPITYDEIAKELFGPHADKRHSTSVRALISKHKEDLRKSATALFGETSVISKDGRPTKKGLYWNGSE